MKKIMPYILILGCAASGYLYYKMNPNDPIVASVFAIGLTGILLSYLRNSK